MPASEKAPSRVPASVLATISIISLCVLSYEVTLTRTFSVVLRYHYVFFVVSLAICGLGVGGLAQYLLLRSRAAPVASSPLWPAALALALALLLPAGQVALVLGGNSLLLSPGRLFLALLLPLPAFLVSGLLLTELFRRYAAHGGRLYYADLGGAALGSAAVVLLLSVVGAINSPFVLALLAASAAVVAAGFRGWSFWILGFALASINVGGLISNQLLGWLDFRPVRNLPPGLEDVVKPMLRDLGDPAQRGHVLDTAWSAFARADLVRFRPDEHSSYFIFTDGETPATLIPFHGDLNAISWLRGELMYFPFTLGSAPAVLSIGPGGGLDVLLAKLAGSRRIVGVEVNSSILALMKRNRHLTGDIYRQPGVGLVLDEGRSFVRRSREKYDLILSSLTQTATTGNVGLALVESYIHTKQAFADYYDHLAPGGRFALVLQEFPLLVRSFLTAASVMQERGLSLPQASRCLIAISLPEELFGATPYRHLLVWQKTPFTPQQLEAARREALRPDRIAYFVPGVAENPPFLALARGEQTIASLSRSFTHAGRRLNVAPTSDDRPFFLDLNFDTWSAVPAFLRWLAVGSLLAALLLAAALSRRGAKARRGRARPLALLSLYFCAIGAGFMLVEIPLVQKSILFVGYPTLSLSVILFSLLLGGSLGSLASQRWPVSGLASLVAPVGALIALAAAAYPRLLGLVFPTLVGFNLPGRAIISAFLLLPLGFLLGMPFPSGIRLAQRLCPEEVPWLWGLNGLTTVSGSVFAVIGAKLVGLNATPLLAAACYLSLFLPCRALRRETATPER